MLSFSIITPTFNAARFLNETIQSIVAQKGENIDHWIVDGGSKDQTLEIAKKQHFSHWQILKGKGQSAAINWGWKHSNGEIISWLNSDDLLLPGTLKLVKAYFMTHPKTDIVYGDCDYIDGEGKTLRSYPTEPYCYTGLIRSAFNYIPQPATFIRRSVLEKIGGLNEDLHYVMDYDYWLRAGLYTKIEYLPVKLAALRIHDDAKSVADLSSFAPELVKIFKSLFKLPDLPDDIQSLETDTMNIVYIRASNCAYWGGDIVSARQYALEAWRKHPFQLNQQILMAIFGRLGRSVLLHLRRRDPCTLQRKKHG